MTRRINVGKPTALANNCNGESLEQSETVTGQVALPPTARVPGNCTPPHPTPFTACNYHVGQRFVTTSSTPGSVSTAVTANPSSWCPQLRPPTSNVRGRHKAYPLLVAYLCHIGNIGGLFFSGPIQGAVGKKRAILPTWKTNYYILIAVPLTSALVVE